MQSEGSQQPDRLCGLESTSCVVSCIVVEIFGRQALTISGDVRMASSIFIPQTIEKLSVIVLAHQGWWLD